MPLLNEKGVIVDLWSRNVDEKPQYLLAPFSIIDDAIKNKSASQNIGVEIPNNIKAEQLLPYFSDVSLIAIVFPAFSDGRGFSIAKSLRLLGFNGVIRAVGPMIADQFAYALASGITQIELSEEVFARQPFTQWQEALKSVGHNYQRGYEKLAYAAEKNILEQRRAARASKTSDGGVA